MKKNIHAMYDHHTFLIMGMVLGRSSNCIDVGAHCGSVLDEIINLAPDGVHYAFEPIPYMYESLKADSKYAAVHIYDLALSDESRESVFYLVKNDPAYSGLKQRRYDRPDPELEEIRAKTARLDDVIGLGERIDFIKIDVEGAELPVMRGAERVICESRPYIVFESGLGASDRYGTDGRKLYDFLVNRCGMEINTLDGFLLGRESLTLDGMVAIFDATERYYFVASPELDEYERREHLRCYVLDIDARLVELASLGESMSRLEARQDAFEAMLPEVQVQDWGPRSTRKGIGINAQPDGESAMWIKAPGISRLRNAIVWFGRHRARGEAWVDGPLLTTHVPKAVIDQPGAYDVAVVCGSGRRLHVGTFVVEP